MESDVLYRMLRDRYGPQDWWPARGPYEMMVGAVLTQNTSWENALRAVCALGDPPHPETLCRLSPEELEARIRPSGFYRQKAGTLRRLTRWYRESCRDPGFPGNRATGELRRDLLAIRGIGPETADSIVLYGFFRPVCVVDAYTRRILGRLGREVPPGYEALREELEAGIGADVPRLQEFHALLVTLAKDTCRTRPNCGACALRQACQYPRTARKKE